MVSFYLYIPAIVFAVWQFTERSRMERHARLQQRLQQVPQCIPRSMPVFAGLVAASFVFRALWFFARGTDILGTQDPGASSCRSGLHCAEQILASFFNRLGQTIFFAAFAIIASFLRKWGQSLEQEGARISERDCVDLSFMLLSFYQALLQVGILLLFLFFDVGEDADGYESFYLYSVVFSNVALALAVSLSGCSLVSRLGALLHHRARDARFRVAVIQWTVSVLLLLKSFLFVMRPLFGIVLTGEVGAVAYPWFFYTVPELVSGCLVLALTSPHGKDGTRDDGDDPKGCRRQVVACLAACLPTCCIECGFAVGGCCDWLLRSCCCCCCCAPDGADSGPGAELASLERSATRLRGPFGERLLWRLAASEGRDMLELVMRTGPSLSARDEAAAAQPTHRDDGRIALLADDELGHPTAGRGVAAPIADERCAAGWV
ncbi:hypothetical protein FNF29_01882 [Cafeteria roenbergensis]|uniref:THH1/TOM1/TOM3 domain-containing protein n=1 Tax=Cafeteria roenbergensis TaxID=33653 RepID=A0A5A8CTM4_CAFRO|nr:hypothetical protein FNF29_01882 [Cafeteria roenbergensis]|eukprot:KAA0155131.1 hypothetical protein FNF29_01882 [Cafeteria roenbergensis]